MRLLGPAGHTIHEHPGGKEGTCRRLGVGTLICGEGREADGLESVFCIPYVYFRLPMKLTDKSSWGNDASSLRKAQM